MMLRSGLLQGSAKQLITGKNTWEVSLIDLLVRSDLTDRDKILLLLLQELQNTGPAVRYADLAETMGISARTVSRRCRELRDRGVMSSVRVGPRQWKHTITPIKGSRIGYDGGMPC